MQPSSPEHKNNWKNLIQEQQKSGISAPEFCKKYNLRINQFYYYKDKLFSNAKKATPFVEVKVKEPEKKEKSQSRITISFKTLSIVFEGEHDANLIVDLCLKLDGKR